MIGRMLSLSLYGWGLAIGAMTLIPMVIGFPIVRLQEVQCVQDATEPTPESTRAWIDFQKPVDAQQCIGPEGSKLIPENPKIASQWSFSEGVLTASPKWDSVVTPQGNRTSRASWHNDCVRI